MIRQIHHNLYRIELPMPLSAMGTTNCYLLRNPGGRHLLVDSGVPHPQCRQELGRALDDLGISLDRLDFLVTHHHHDHLGLASLMAGPRNRIFLPAVEKALVDSGEFWLPALARGALLGFSPGELKEIDAGYRRSYPPGFLAKTQVIAVAPGETLELAGQHITGLAAPGHTSGQLCYACPALGATFCGDQVLAELTPSVHTHMGEADPVSAYLQSLEQLALAPPRLLPGHGPPAPDGPARLSQLARRHAQRLAEVADHLARSPLTVPELAGLISWRNPPGAPPAMLWLRWIGAGEAHAYLAHLEAKGRARQENGRYHPL